jgi:hypothetical protein
MHYGCIKIFSTINTLILVYDISVQYKYKHLSLILYILKKICSQFSQIELTFQIIFKEFIRTILDKPLNFNDKGFLKFISTLNHFALGSLLIFIKNNTPEIFKLRAVIE